MTGLIQSTPAEPGSAPERVSGREVAEQIRRALRGELAITWADPAHSWTSTYCGDVGLKLGEWTLVFFNDCDELDYCDRATAPDGRSGEFEQWYDDKVEPVSLLSQDEISAFESLLEQASQR